VDVNAMLWERHGSTRPLFTDEEFNAACQYVRELQDNPDEREYT
jgi:hypothetical protein